MRVSSRTVNFVLELLPSWTFLSAFLIASFVLAVTPGPGVLYILARSLSQGRASGLMSVAGVALGNFGNSVAASFGLAALFAVSSLAFTAIKYAGAAYLIYLGVQALRSRSASSDQRVPEVERLNRGRIFRDGFIVALLNPKTTIFFAAFLPQFIDPKASVAAQSVMLGAIFVAIAALTDSLYAHAASRIAPLFARAKNASAVGRYFSGFTYIAMGVLAAFSSQKTNRT
ncbi:MAG: LysE family translocator [Betaproteobacteria bacterium]|nr:MAG: LysE family translocator [Betaproteobacteria bacterium]